MSVILQYAIKYAIKINVLCTMHGALHCMLNEFIHLHKNPLKS